MRAYFIAAVAIILATAFSPAETSAPGDAGSETVSATERAGVAPARAQTRMRMSTRPDGGRLSAEVQRALESGDARAAAMLLPAVQAARAAAPATPAAATDLAASTGGQEYICNSGSCACAGASDCVDMVAGGHCVEGTVGCNDWGCTCQGSD
ncbi:hypothetical protein FKB34_01370 [Glycocaulis profundi]|nr:hypothetical protein FKB34_01370 [Glycocaulis profundi]